MALQFQSPPGDQQYTISAFAGADFTTEASKVESSFSPDTKNMLQNRNGYVEKRTGTRRVFEPGATGSDGKINGIFEYNCPDNNQTYHFIHIGTKLYRFSFGADKQIVLGGLLLTGLADKKSRSFSIGGALYIIGAGYIKIGYDDITGTLCYGFVSQASAENIEADAPLIISGRSRSSGPSAANLDGERHDYCAHNTYKKIGFALDTYRFRETNYPHRLYVAPPELKSRMRVVSLYMAETNSDGTKQYFRVDERQYNVVSDAKGLSVELTRPPLTDEVQYYCEPYVIVEYNNFVYAPTVVTGRQPLPVNEIGGDVIDENGKVTTNYEAYTGEVLESVNLASGLRRIDFYRPTGFWQGTGVKGMRLHLSPEGDGFVTGVYIDGVPIQMYTSHEDKQVVYTYRAEFVDLDSSVVVSANTECVISVTYMLTDGESDVIDNCSIGALYGGSNDTRVFVSGNEKYPARDFASGLYDASYFPDTGYTDVGAQDSAIVGYHKLYGSMIIVKDGKGGDSAQYLRTFALKENAAGSVVPIFAVKQGNISYGASSVSSFKNVGGVPLYIGADGVFAISGTNVENQNNTESISRRINGRLLGETLKEAVCAAAGGRYYVFIGDHAYVCDVENGCVWSYFDALPEVRCVWAGETGLYLGTEQGTVYRFMDESEENAYYDDVAVDGSLDSARAIEAVWEIPRTVLGSYTNYKTVRNCYITCMPYGRSSVKVYYNTNEDYRDWVLGENIDLFSFDDVDFSRFTFRTIAAPFVFATGVKVKNVYVFGLRLVNDTPGEPFGFLAVSVKYRMGKYVK